MALCRVRRFRLNATLVGKYDRKLARSQNAASSSRSALVSGMAAPIQKRFETRSDGSVVSQLVMQIRDLAPPERRYSAEEAFVTFNGTDAVSFHFLQRKLSGEIRSLVSVKMYSDSARQYHETLNAIAEPLEQFVTRSDVDVPEVKMPADEPPHTVAMVASVAQTTFGGFEAEMSFYHVSPYGLHLATVNEAADSVAVEPVVRVDLPTTMLVGIVRQLAVLIPKLPKSDP